MRNHVVITGTGRAGTTFLVKLLTHLGLDTGYTVDELEGLTSKISRAGLEHDIFNDYCPYIVKNPRFCDVADRVFQASGIRVERVFIPIRNLGTAAESRRKITRQGEVKGGLWDTDSLVVGVQESILQKKIYDVVLSLSVKNIPVTFIHYPTLILDSNYLFQKIRPILKDIPEHRFHSVFEAVVDRNAPSVIEA
jgi:hypothetical protein